MTGKSSNTRGAYSERRTKTWLESLGYDVVPMERRHRVVGKDDRIFFVRHDLWGCDLLAKNTEEVVFIQVKSSETQIPEGLRALKKAGPWPACAKVWVVYWPRGRRLSVGPEIEEYQ